MVRNNPTKSSTQGADEKLVGVLEETAAHKLLEQLDRVLPDLARTAVREAIVVAMHSDGVVLPQREERSFAPRNPERESRKPKQGGVCEAVWKELDKLAKKGAVPSLSSIQAVGQKKGWNPNNTRVEYYAWRKHKGISGRQARSAEVQPAAH